jgi:hypothetical protein
MSETDSTRPLQRGERTVEAVHSLVRQERERAAANALQAVRRALVRHGPAHVLGVLNHLEQQPLAVTLEALEHRDVPQ